MRVVIFTFLLLMIDSSLVHAYSLNWVAMTSLAIEIQEAIKRPDSQTGPIHIRYTKQTWDWQKQQLVNKGLLLLQPNKSIDPGQKLDELKAIAAAEYVETLGKRLSFGQIEQWRNNHLPAYYRTQAKNAEARDQIRSIMSFFPVQSSSLLAANNFTSFSAAQVLGMGVRQSFLDLIFFEKNQNSGLATSFRSPTDILQFLRSAIFEYIPGFSMEQQEQLFIFYLGHYLPRLSVDFNLVLLAQLILSNPQTFFTSFEGSLLQTRLIELTRVYEETPQSLCVPLLASGIRLGSSRN